MDDDDEQLRMALALSMQPDGHRQHASSRMDTNAKDDDDEARFQHDLQAALELSKATSEPAPQSTSAFHTSSAVVGPSRFLSERAQLEQERLQRQKRVLEDPDAGPSTKRVHVSAATNEKGRETAAPELFWDGEIRQTYNAYVTADRTRPVFKMKDVITQPEDLEFVLLSSFGTDFPWVQSTLRPGTPVLCVGSPSDDRQQRSQTRVMEGPLPGWWSMLPNMGGKGVMHVKLIMLFYKSGRLRLVIPTANLVGEDWHTIENTVFLQDFPARTIPTNTQPHVFPTYLARFLNLLSVPAGLSAMSQAGRRLPLTSLDDLASKWDWNRVKARLVGSPAGTHEGWDVVKMWGHTRLGAVVREMNATPPKGKALQLECQGSSIGNYTRQYLYEFYASASGTHWSKYIEIRKSQLAQSAWPPIKVIFPSLQTVDDTVYGRMGGSSFFCNPKYWEKKEPAKRLFHDCKARSGKVLMHTKMILGTYADKPAPAQGGSEPANGKANGKGKKSAKKPAKKPDSETEDETETEDESGEPLLGWAYIGSHNFSMAAWGSVSGTAAEPKVHMSNFELGIVLPIHDAAMMERIVPWTRPAPAYGRGDVPWMQQVHMQEVLAGLEWAG